MAWSQGGKNAKKNFILSYRNTVISGGNNSVSDEKKGGGKGDPSLSPHLRRHPTTPPPQGEKDAPPVKERETTATRARTPKNVERKVVRPTTAQQVGENLWAVVAGPFKVPAVESTARALWRARVNVRIFTRQEGGYLVLGATTKRQAESIKKAIAGKGIAREKIFILPPKEKL